MSCIAEKIYFMKKKYDRERFRWLVDDAKEQSVMCYERGKGENTLVGSL